MEELNLVYGTLCFNVWAIRHIILNEYTKIVQSAWGSRGERVRATELATYCNYFSKFFIYLFLF